MAAGKNEWLVTLTNQVKKAEGTGTITWNEVDTSAKARYITTNLDGQADTITSTATPTTAPVCEAPEPAHKQMNGSGLTSAPPK